MEYSDLTDEQKAKAKACETAEELMALAREEGVELTDAQLEAVSGGASAWDNAIGCSEKCKTNYSCPEEGQCLQLRL